MTVIRPLPHGQAILRISFLSVPMVPTLNGSRRSCEMIKGISPQGSFRESAASRVRLFRVLIVSTGLQMNLFFSRGSFIDAARADPYFGTIMHFKIGDLVQLKSGGPAMTITKEQGYGPLENKVTCTWYVGDECKERQFDPAVLKASDSGPSKRTA